MQRANEIRDVGQDNVAAISLSDGAPRGSAASTESLDRVGYFLFFFYPRSETAH